MKISYLTLLVLGGLFSLAAIGLSVASFSGYRKASRRKELPNESKDTLESSPVQGADLAQPAAEEGGTQVKAIVTSDGDLEDSKVWRIKKYNSNGKPVL